MDIYNLYQTSILQENGGRPFTKEFGGDATFLIARAGNPKYSRLLTAEYETHKAILDDKSSEAAKDAATACSDAIMVRIMAKSILLGWTGNVKFKGADLPYSVENAALLLAIPEFRKKVSGLSDDYRNYREVQEAADEKNSGPTPNGASPGDPESTSSVA